MFMKTFLLTAAIMSIMYNKRILNSLYTQPYGVGIINGWSWGEIYQARKKNRRNKFFKRYHNN